MGLEVRRKVSRHRPSQAPLADDCCVEKPLMCENKQVQSGHCKHPAPQPIISSLSGDKKNLFGNKHRQENSLFSE